MAPNPPAVPGTPGHEASAHWCPGRGLHRGEKSLSTLRPGPIAACHLHLLPSTGLQPAALLRLTSTLPQRSHRGRSTVGSWFQPTCGLLLTNSSSIPARNLARRLSLSCSISRDIASCSRHSFIPVSSSRLLPCLTMAHLCGGRKVEKESSKGVNKSWPKNSEPFRENSSKKQSNWQQQVRSP